jgi:hypothetical protein
MAGVLTLAVADMPDIEFLRGVQERTGLTPFIFVALLTDITNYLQEQVGPLDVSPEPVDIASQPEENVVDEFEIEDASDWQQGLEIFDEADASPEETPEPAESESLFGGDSEDEGWKSIFDTGNEQVLKEIDHE